MFRIIFSGLLLLSSFSSINSQVDSCDIDIEYFVNIDCTDPDVIQSVFQVNVIHPESDSFDLYQDGNLLQRFAYSIDQDTIIRPDNGSSQIVICDMASLSCCDTLNVLASCECAIYDMEYTMSSCDEVDGNFNLLIDFQYFMTSDSFDLGGNGNNFGTHAYEDLPIELGPFDFNSTDYDIVAFDQLNAFCFNFIHPGNISECDTTCHIFNLLVEFNDCVDEDYFIVDFEFEHNQDGGLFEFSVDGNPLDTFEYGESFYTSSIIFSDCTDIQTYSIRDLDEPACIDEYILSDTICCHIIDDCIITNLIGSVVECDELGMFYIDFEFNSTQTEGDFEFIFDGEVIETFEYGQDAYIVGPLETDCITLYEISIQDAEIESCMDNYQFQDAICCDDIDDCDFSSFIVTAGPCDENGNFSISFTFEYVPTNSDSFYIELDNEQLATLPYGDTIYVLDNFAGDCVTEYKFLLRDQLDEMCISNFALLGTVCCDTLIPCDISDVSAEITPCDDAGNFFVELDFQVDTLLTGDFIVSGNGMVYDTFSYNQSDYVVGPLEGDCETLYEFVITDILDDSCTDFIAFQKVICCDPEVPCSISNVQAEIAPCDLNDQFLVEITFDVDSILTGSFNITGNGMDHGTFMYNTGSYIVGPLDGDCETLYEFVITDGIDLTCTNSTVLDTTVCCEIDDLCPIEDVQVDITACDDQGNFGVTLTVVSDTLSGFFAVSGNGVIYDTLSYNIGNFELGPFPGDCETIYEFVITDLQDSTCMDFIEFNEVICCDTIAECHIGEINIESLNCFEDNYIVSYSFEFENTSDVGYDIFVNDEFFAFKPYEAFPASIILDNLNPSDTTTLFQICDNDNPDCCNSVLIDLTACNDGPCVLDNIDISYTECLADSFNILIDFEFENTSNSFFVVGNGNEYGQFEYGELPIELGPFFGIDSLTYELVIHDAEEDCLLLADFMGIDCTDTAVSEIEEIGLIYYVNDRLILDSNFQAERLSLFDIQGKVMIQVDHPKDSVNLPNLTQGIYLLIVEDNGTLRSQKILVY